MRQGMISYLAPVLDRGLAGLEEPRELKPGDGAPRGTTVIGLGRGVDLAVMSWAWYLRPANARPTVGLSWA